MPKLVDTFGPIMFLTEMEMKFVEFFGTEERPMYLTEFTRFWTNLSWSEKVDYWNQFASF